MTYQNFTLPNGIRIIHKQVNTAVAHCGIIINTGTRDEDNDEHGVAHLIEHMIFKGTTKRKAFHILSRLDDVGGDLNAYTSKEEIVIYASFLNEHYERTLELFSDIIFNSTYPDKELEKEKDVIVEEINSYKDSPSEQIFDDFEEIIFRNHPIGRNILGDINGIKNYNRKKLLDFVLKNFNTDEIVISTIGNISLDELKYIIEKYFIDFKANHRIKKRNTFNNYKPIKKYIDTNNYQTNCIIGNIAYNVRDKNKTAFILLNNILGGPAMNSRLNLSLREKHGFSYNIESVYTPYTDTGIWALYFGTDKDNADKSIQIIYKELNKLRSEKLGPVQLKKAKQQIIGQIAVSNSSYMNEMLSMGKSFLLFNTVDTLEEINKEIDTITSKKIQDIANKVFNEKQLSLLMFKSN